MNWVLHLIIVCSIIVSYDASQCPKGDGCGPCELYTADRYQIRCGEINETNSAFNIELKVAEYVSITCSNQPNWSEFHLGSKEPITGIKAISISLCQLPQDDKLGDIVKTLLTDNVENLIFSSYDNLTSSLSRETLRGFESVKRLTLSSNGLMTIPEDLLQDLPNLILLNLRQNDLQKLPARFLNTPKLNTLELGNNNLEIIKVGVFDKLENLELLNVWSNKLIKIEPHAFDKLTSIKSIDLHINNLQSLPKGLFHNNKNLRVINLSQNNFTYGSLSDDLFQHNIILENVSLTLNKQNMTTLPNKFFANLTKLMNVKLTKIGLTVVPENLFWGSINIKNLYMDRNYLQTIPNNFFKDCQNLKTLTLNFNELTHLPDGIFMTLNKLETLDLSKNHFTTISKNLLDGLSSLRTINMESNQLKTIDAKAFQNLKNLRIGHFSQNNLTLKSSLTQYVDKYGPSSPFHLCQDTLEELYLDHNNITEIFFDWITSLRLRTLNLAYNHLHFLETSDLQFLSNKIHVNLTYNEIQSIFLRDVEDFAQSQRHPRDVFIDVRKNPISCDCNVYDLLRYIEGNMHPYVQNLFSLNVGNITCNRPESVKGVDIHYIKSSSLTCEMAESLCPQNCKCSARPSDKAVLIDCSYRGLDDVPASLLVPPKRRVELNLTGNHLTSMPSLMQPGYNQVALLDLSKNNITDIKLESLSTNLESLYLNDNNLRQINSEVLDFWKNSTKLLNLTLQRNPWVCDCEARNFTNFIQTMRVKISNLQDVMCASTNLYIFEITPNELCPISLDLIIGLSMGVALLGIILGILTALHYRHQHEIKVWLYAHRLCLWFVTENELDKDKSYDAFISFSQKDEEFITKELVPKLEEGPKPFKLCVHYRDWKAGEWIPRQITKSIQDSRRTIVVLSPNFLESVWGRLEFRAAHRQALNEGRARVIVILYGDIGSTDDLDPELKAYLNMNTYVRWGDPWFWDKLRYALPHANDFLKNQKKQDIQGIYETHQPIIHINTDKSELIYSNDISTISTPTSTPPADAAKTLTYIES